ncbi:protein COFACTOR ASSEMBLY OF COMPLEX C SUBUNIT B CCB4, chloroplastic-like [Mangifera indica]|uniref:protein COFACTOR ASSEMBLY OF COMPLEX C SUBUNIT B CCB4, chloroplastic-like n=1 Tax=Mangifera indica TaxID=29780 RepID=UPI001CFA0BD4|nr:protein COFACTOR ASSEMBLY OF COMPLEX C SUBUNIT B CCB4, chloroplastic-like [Mangifera indica]
MEAGIIFYTTVPWNLKRSFPRNNRDFPRFIRASANLQSQKKSYQGPKPSKDWAADCSTNNDDIIRSLPIYVRGVSLLAVLFNGTVSDIAPVADASSSVDYEKFACSTSFHEMLNNWDMKGGNYRFELIHAPIDLFIFFGKSKN